MTNFVNTLLAIIIIYNNERLVIATNCYWSHCDPKKNKSAAESES